MSIGLYIREPSWICLPLYGLYPGQVSFTGAALHQLAIWCWVVVAGLVFAGLGLLALLRNHRVAATGFVILLVVSSYFGLAKAG